MKSTLVGILVIGGLLGVGFAGMARANSAVGGDEPAIMASPNVIVLAKVSTITVHTNIPAVTVQSDTIALNEVSPTSVGVDSCGHVVAKFAVADLDLTRGTATLTLSGTFVGGGLFSAGDMVTVK